MDSESGPGVLHNEVHRLHAMSRAMFYPPKRRLFFFICFNVDASQRARSLLCLQWRIQKLGWGGGYK